ncbi:MAG: hypothetical protein FWG25_06250 [Promicromonosporaceae bacterium]|nr:hypothetical protein [Promicromonosporaceae bacterium]
MYIDLSFENHALKATELFSALLVELSDELSDDTKQSLIDIVNCGELDSAIEGILDMSGASHLFVIPSSFAQRIESWVADFEPFGPDDDDYIRYAADRAMSYSRDQERQHSPLAMV